MKRKKSINDLYNQLIKFKGTEYFMKAFFAYQRTFVQIFGFSPHSIECANFCLKYGKDYKM